MVFPWNDQRLAVRTVTSHLRGIVHTSAEGPRPQGTWTSIQCQVFEEHINDMISHVYIYIYIYGTPLENLEAFFGFNMLQYKSSSETFARTPWWKSCHWSCIYPLLSISFDFRILQWSSWLSISTWYTSLPFVNHLLTHRHASKLVQRGVVYLHLVYFIVLRKPSAHTSACK